MNKGKNIARYDTKFAHQFLLKNPGTCWLLAGVTLFAAIGSYLDWFGHSSWNPTWQTKNTIAAGFFGLLSLVFALYGFFASRSRKH